MTFEIRARLDAHPLARTGVLATPHGDIATPAFVPVGTKATVKAVAPEAIADVGAQAVLANAYHLYLQPGSDIVDEAGGLGKFMNWPGPTFTDSGGFQVLSLGSGFKKVLSEEFSGSPHADGTVAPWKERLADVDDDGVWFRSHLDGSRHRFTPEVSMRIQHELGADVIFAFDELTTLLNSRAYQEEALERTRRWALRCLAAHRALTAEREGKPYQQLFGVVQGAQYEDLRRKAARDLGAMEAISEPDDFFAAVEAGADTFDCVNPSRVARNAAIYSPDGRFNLTRAQFRRDFNPLVPGCGCYTCTHYSRAYLHHLYKAKEMLFSTLATIHNEHFTVRLVDGIRAAIETGDSADVQEETLGRFYAGKWGRSAGEKQ